MQCSECEAPVDDGAGVCPGCGAVLDGTATDPGSSDLVEAAPTVVTGAASATLPRKGQVLAERYEVQKRLGGDALTVRYHAFDQEAESSVLLTVVDPSRLGSQRDRDAVRERVSHTLGSGGRYLSSLLDCDREGALVFTVEGWPSGTAFHDVMRARASRGERFTPAEILPVVSQISAALEAIPPPFCHGDVRASRVWIDPDGLRLTGAFMVSLLPAEAIVAAVRADSKLRWQLAPEAQRGSISDSGDRWGTAAIALEALSGVTPEHVAFHNLAIPAPIAEALRDLMATDASTRPPTLRPLIAALAQAAALPVPAFEPAPFRRVRRAGASERSLPTLTSSGALTVVKSGDDAPGVKDAAAAVSTPAEAPATTPFDEAPVGLEDAPTVARDGATRRVVGKPPPVGLEDAPTTRRDEGYLDDAPTVEAETLTKQLSADSTQRVVPSADSQADGEGGDGPITHDTSPATVLADAALEESIPPTTPPPPATTPPAPAPAPSAAFTSATDPTSDVQTTSPRVAPAAGARLAHRPAADVIVTPERKTVRLERDADDAPVSFESKPTAPRRIPGAAADGTQELSIDAIIESHPAGPRRIAGAAPEGTQEISADAILESRPTTKHDTERPQARKPASETSGVELDPRLVRAALDLQDDGSGPRRPRAESTLELGPGDIEMVAAAVLSQNAAAAKAEAAPAPSGAAATSPVPAARPVAASKAAAPRLRRDPTPVRIPHDIKPIPRPRTSSGSGFPAAAPGGVLFDDSRREDAPTGPYSAQPGADAAPAPPPAAPPPGAPMTAAPGAGAMRPRLSSPALGAPVVAAPPPSVQSPRLAPPPRAGAPASPSPHAAVTPRTPMSAAVAPAPRAPAAYPAAGAARSQFGSVSGAHAASDREENTASHPRSRAGRWIILLAIVLAAAIIGMGLLVAQRRRVAADRERAVQDRLELIRRQEGSQ